MPPKKAAPAKKAASTASHPPYLDMIKEAVVALKEKGGSSRQALKKYVQANNDLKGVTDAAFTTQFNKALLKGSESGTFTRPKGSSGPVKLAAPSAAAKPAAKKTATAAKPATAVKSATAAKPKTAKATTAKKPAAKKATTTKSATAKKPAAKKATATKTKSKANTTKVRKTPAAAPAVVEEKPVVLGKTKSGRVTKSKAPAEARKAIAPKNSRKAPAKKATAKKA